MRVKAGITVSIRRSAGRAVRAPNNHQLILGGCHVTAGRYLEVIDTITSEFTGYGLTTHINRNILPSPDDTSTLFTIAGMQPLKPRFHSPDGTEMASFQSCVRTNDLDEVGDGSHLTSFTMVGSFGFGSNTYEEHCRLWSQIVTRLGINVTHVTYHPDTNHNRLWESLGYSTTPDSSCTWSASPTDPLSYCCELFCGDLEIGNLVNPSGTSIDVGFGLERLVMVVEGKGRVDETSMFDSRLSPIGRDHARTIELLLENRVRPGNKGREYVCRRLMRRLLRSDAGIDLSFLSFYAELQKEEEGFERRIRTASKDYRKNPNQPADYWWGTHGMLPEEIHLLG